MLATTIRHLLDSKLTSVKELETVTGRGTSTIYRWMSGESEPHYQDMRRLVRRLQKPEARRTLVGMLTSDLPIVVNWIPDEAHMTEEKPEKQEEEERGGNEVLDRSLLALDCLSDALSEGNDAIRRKELTRASYIKLVTLVDETIHHLTSSKNLLKKYSPIKDAAAGEPDPQE